jgi:DNA-binding IclR family transcriptional regulator
MTTRVTAATQILEFLGSYRGLFFPKPHIAKTLNLPQDSVRRVVNELRKAGRVQMSWDGKQFAAL